MKNFKNILRKITFCGSIIFALVILGLGLNPALAAREVKPIPPSKPKNEATINDIMVQFSNHIIELEPFIMSIDRFSDPKNSQTITQHLTGMIELAKKAGHSSRMESSLGLQVNRQILEDHLMESERVFRLGNKNYAHWMVNSTINICMSCHTQMPGIERKFDVFGQKDKSISTFERAEILFTFRNFEKSLELFDEVIAGYPDNQVKIDKIESALRRKLTYYVRVKQDPKGAIASLNKSVLNNKLPEVLKKSIMDWNSSLKKWSKTPTPSVTKATNSEVQTFVQKLLEDELANKDTMANDRIVNYLRVSGFLYQYLDQQKPMTDSKNAGLLPDILYWLSVCDRRLSSDLFYSLSDIYLKDCVNRFPDSPVAKKCFHEYKDSVVFSYTGSSGTHIPNDVQSELNKMEELIKK